MTDCCRCAPLLVFITATALAVLANSASAQARSGIRAGGGDQTMVHNERPTAQVFPATVWDVDTKSKRGATVTLSCGPFENRNEPGSYIDGQLGLRVRASQNRANWTVKVARDRTRITGGNKVATVMAASEDKGFGSLELEVTFLGADVVDLVEGDYITTVTGTITAH